MVSKSIYVGLLESAFHKKPLFTGRKDGTNRSIRFEKDAMLFFDADDGRIIAHQDLKHISSFTPSTIFGAEICKREKKGDNSNIFEYDETGKYIGIKVNGNLVKPEDLSKPHSNYSCVQCGKETKQRCGKCRIVFYCSRKCQESDWSSHKGICKITTLDVDGNVIMIPK